MKKPVLIFLWIFLCLNILVGQDNNTSDSILWREGYNLTWADFKGEVIDLPNYCGECFCMNLANFKRANILLPFYCQVASAFDRTKSWVNPECQNDQLLLYFQVMFNIYELHARKLRKDFSEIKFGKDPTPVFNEKYNASMTALTSYLNNYRVETKMGTDIDNLKKSDAKVKEELNELSEFK